MVLHFVELQKIKSFRKDVIFKSSFNLFLKELPILLSKITKLSLLWLKNPNCGI